MEKATYIVLTSKEISFEYRVYIERVFDGTDFKFFYILMVIHYYEILIV
jgi:hypothetical protein